MSPDIQTQIPTSHHCGESLMNLLYEPYPKAKRKQTGWDFLAEEEKKKNLKVMHLKNIYSHFNNNATFKVTEITYLSHSDAQSEL